MNRKDFDVVAVLRDYCAQHGAPEDFQAAIAAIADLIAAVDGADDALEKAYIAKSELLKTQRELRIYGKGPDSCRQRIASRAIDGFDRAVIELRAAQRRKRAAIDACRPAPEEGGAA